MGLSLPLPGPASNRPVRTAALARCVKAAARRRAFITREYYRRGKGASSRAKAGWYHPPRPPAEGAWQTAKLRRRYAPEALCAYPDASLAIKGREDSKSELYSRPQEADPVQLTRFGRGVGFPFAHLIAHIKQFDLL